jgi:hypothetical protein
MKSRAILTTSHCIAVAMIMIIALPASAGCPATAAAQSAYDKKIAAIDASKPDPSSYFDCLGDVFSKSPNLGDMIPDPIGILTSAGKAAIDAAKNAYNSACRAVRDTVTDIKNAPGDAVKDATSSVGTGVTGVVTKPINDAGSEVNGTINQGDSAARDAVRYNVSNPIQSTGSKVFN